ncbi:LVIVD repeat-containing protein [Salinilacihabitans rarus]|uniref:LVIVD repeat-containing protein n=1 Tax=Salinilacihabitans rarus TaxID=2961596 RepID=UPI0020C87C31|nr:hypothetical protein [Salinilacihabitans rarus]
MHRRALLRAGAALGAGVFGSAAAPAVGAAQTDEGYEPLGRVPVEGAAEAVVGDDGETAYLAAVDGFAVVDVSDPAEPTVLADRRALLDDEDERPPLVDVLDAKVDGDRLAVVGPANPATGNAFQGVLLYDVSDPADPVRVGEPYATDFHIHNCHFADGTLYLAGNDGEANPLVIVDASDDDPEEVGRWSPLEVDPAWREVDQLLRYLHDVTVRDGVAALPYWDAGTYLVDVGDPTDPELRSHVPAVDPEAVTDLDGPEVTEAQQALPGNDHYAAFDEAGEVLAVGREAWSTRAGDPDGAGGIDLFDASESGEPTPLTTISAPETYDASYRTGAWTTSHNFELRDGLLFSSWYRGGVAIHDVSDPADPEEVARWRDPETAAFWTARVATDDVFVASSTSLLPNAPTEGALYAFPIEAGRQVDPPALVDPDEEGASNETNGTNETDDAATPDPSDDGNASGSGEEAAANPVPGFTAAGAVAGGAVALAAALAAARRRARRR